MGTSTNIIVSNLSRPGRLGALIGMFELARVGLPMACRRHRLSDPDRPRLLPSHAAATCHVDERGQSRTYLAELQLARYQRLNRPHAGRSGGQLSRPSKSSNWCGDPTFSTPCRDAVCIAPGDLLLVKGSPTDLVAVLAAGLVELPHRRSDLTSAGSGPEALIVELVIPPQSGLLAASDCRIAGCSGMKTSRSWPSSAAAITTPT